VKTKLLASLLGLALAVSALGATPAQTRWEYGELRYVKDPWHAIGDIVFWNCSEAAMVGEGDSSEASLLEKLNPKKKGTLSTFNEGGRVALFNELASRGWELVLFHIEKDGTERDFVFRRALPSSG
jgi:hypothetical protein